MTLIKSFLTALLGSVVANVVLLFAFRSLVINPAQPLMALSAGPVVIFTAIGAIGATMVYAILRALMRNPNKVFVWISAVLLVLSLYPDYLIVGQTTGSFAGGTWPSALLLMAMHVAAAVIIVWSLVRLWGAKPAAISTN